MKTGTDSRFRDAVAPRPLTELLACPADVGSLLTASIQNMQFETGQVIFSQSDPSLGLYLVVAGQLQRRAQRQQSRLILGTVRPGDLVELAAALGDPFHTCSLIGQSEGSLLLLPMMALHTAFESHPPLRMHLLEELAREISRSYRACRTDPGFRARSRRRRGVAEI